MFVAIYDCSTSLCLNYFIKSVTIITNCFIIRITIATATAIFIIITTIIMIIITTTTTKTINSDKMNL